MLYPGVQKIVYNWQIALLPILAAAAGLRDDFRTDEGDGGSRSSSSSSSSGSSGASGARESWMARGRQLPAAAVFDPKIAAWVGDSDIADADTELAALLARHGVRAAGRAVPAIQQAGPPLGRFAVTVAKVRLQAPYTTLPLTAPRAF